MLNTPPASTPAVARPGAPSFRRNAASIWLKRNRGNTARTGVMYRWAMGSRASSAPKKVRSGPSRQRTPAQASRARAMEPITAAVKYWCSVPAALPPTLRLALKRTLPPMPISSPRL